MSPRVFLPAPLRPFADGAAEVDVEAATVDAAIAALVRCYPAMRRHLYDDHGRLRGYVNVYHNDEAARDPHAPLAPDDTLTIVPSIAGGSGDGRHDDERAPDAATLSAGELARYSRHIALPDVGREGQQRLRAARVLIVGVGGLGSPAALYLAAAGIGTIGLVDFDTVDLTNLQRQILYGTDDISRAKLDVAVARLRATNPHVDVIAHALRLTRDNALDVLAGYDIVIDGTDNFPTRYLVNDACVLLGRPYVYGSILRFEGQVAVFDARHGPCYRCLFREPPPPGLVPSCAEGGVLGVLPGIIGSLQALEAIKLVLGRGDTLVGRIALFDALAFRWRELKLRRRPDCALCGERPTITGLIDYDEFCGGGDEMRSEPDALPEITPAELKQRLDTGEPLVLLDVREPFEWEIANLGEHGARLIPMGELVDRIGELDAGAETVVHCRTGSRSAQVVQYLRAQGFTHVHNLKGGIKAWAEQLDPAMPQY
jgi:sulfur-carrier protein adenylyltransferase/sulfurtransferase